MVVIYGDLCFIHHPDPICFLVDGEAFLQRFGGDWEAWCCPFVEILHF